MGNQSPQGKRSFPQAKGDSPQQAGHVGPVTPSFGTPLRGPTPGTSTGNIGNAIGSSGAAGIESSEPSNTTLGTTEGRDSAEGTGAIEALAAPSSSGANFDDAGSGEATAVSSSSCLTSAAAITSTATENIASSSTRNWMNEENWADDPPLSSSTAASGSSIQVTAGVQYSTKRQHQYDEATLRRLRHSRWCSQLPPDRCVSDAWKVPLPATTTTAASHTSPANADAPPLPPQRFAAPAVGGAAAAADWSRASLFGLQTLDQKSQSSTVGYVEPSQAIVTSVPTNWLAEQNWDDEEPNAEQPESRSNAAQCDPGTAAKGRFQYDESMLRRLNDPTRLPRPPIPTDGVVSDAWVVSTSPTPPAAPQPKGTGGGSGSWLAGRTWPTRTQTPTLDKNEAISSQTVISGQFAASLPSPPHPSVSIQKTASPTRPDVTTDLSSGDTPATAAVAVTPSYAAAVVLPSSTSSTGTDGNSSTTEAALIPTVFSRGAKDRMCRNVLAGKFCPFGTSCRFAHSDGELEATSTPMAPAQSFYTAVVLTRESHEKLVATYRAQIPPEWNIHAHHMTVYYGNLDAVRSSSPRLKTVQLGGPVLLRIERLGVSDAAIAVGVSGYPSHNRIAHITLATAPGRKPKESNDITNWATIPSAAQFTVIGMVEEVNGLDSVVRFAEPKSIRNRMSAAEASTSLAEGGTEQTLSPRAATVAETLKDSLGSSSPSPVTEFELLVEDHNTDEDQVDGNLNDEEREAAESSHASSAMEGVETEAETETLPCIETDNDHHHDESVSMATDEEGNAAVQPMTEPTEPTPLAGSPHPITATNVDTAVSETAAAQGSGCVVIFLDIDGVLVPVSPMEMGGGEIDDGCLACLKAIVDSEIEASSPISPNVHIVLTSTWRMPNNKDKLERLNIALKGIGLAPVLAGTPAKASRPTPVSSLSYLKDDPTEQKLVCDRVDEILEWLQGAGAAATHPLCHSPVTKWIAIDDMNLGEDPRMAGHFVHTDISYGLYKSDVQIAMELLKNQTMTTVPQTTATRTESANAEESSNREETVLACYASSSNTTEQHEERLVQDMESEPLGKIEAMDERKQQSCNNESTTEKAKDEEGRRNGEGDDDEDSEGEVILYNSDSIHRIDQLGAVEEEEEEEEGEDE